MKGNFKDTKNKRVSKMRTTPADKPTFILFSTSLHFSVADAIVSFAFVISSCCSSAKKIGKIQILILRWIIPPLRSEVEVLIDYNLLRTTKHTKPRLGRSTGGILG